MKAPDLLGLVIRITGFWMFLYGLWNVWYAVESIPSILMGREFGQRSAFVYLEFGVPVCILGTVFFLFADFFVKLSYRDPQG